MTFEAYLKEKKIDSLLFRQAEPERWAEWEALFAVMHPESFTAQKKFLINPIRRLYQLVEEAPAPKSKGNNPVEAVKEEEGPAAPLVKQPVKITAKPLIRKATPLAEEVKNPRVPPETIENQVEKPEEPL
jgi:hypothetical protein